MPVSLQDKYEYQSWRSQCLETVPPGAYGAFVHRFCLSNIIVFAANPGSLVLTETLFRQCCCLCLFKLYLICSGSLRYSFLSIAWVMSHHTLWSAFRSFRAFHNVSHYYNGIFPWLDFLSKRPARIVRFVWCLWFGHTKCMFAGFDFESNWHLHSSQPLLSFLTRKVFEL